MKLAVSATFLAAALVALVPAVWAAPAGCTTPANAAILNALTITNIVKRTTVNGGAKVVQTVTVQNTGAAVANGLVLSSTPLDPVLTFLKGNTKPRTTVTAAGAAVTSTAFNLAAGATLKATITYKSQRCPAATAAHAVPIQVSVPADPTAVACFLAGPVATVSRRPCALETS